MIENNYSTSYEREWFLLKRYIYEQERLSKAEVMDKMTELETERIMRDIPVKLLPEREAGE